MRERSEDLIEAVDVSAGDIESLFGASIDLVPFKTCFADRRGVNKLSMAVKARVRKERRDVRTGVK